MRTPMRSSEMSPPLSNVQWSPGVRVGRSKQPWNTLPSYFGPRYTVPWISCGPPPGWSHVPFAKQVGGAYWYSYLRQLETDVKWKSPWLVFQVPTHALASGGVGSDSSPAEMAGTSSREASTRSVCVLIGGDGTPRRRTGSSSAPAQRPRARAHPQQTGRRARHDGVRRHVLGHDAARPDDRVVADGDAAQEAGAVADPHVVADAHVALVDALQADRALGLDDAVVEVDQHHAVGDDALAPDRHVLEGRDRALLAEDALGPDVDLALVHADLAAVADPRPAPEVERRVAPDLELHARPHEREAVGPQPAPEAQLQPREP